MCFANTKPRKMYEEKYKKSSSKLSKLKGERGYGHRITIMSLFRDFIFLKENFSENFVVLCVEINHSEGVGFICNLSAAANVETGFWGSNRLLLFFTTHAFRFGRKVKAKSSNNDKKNQIISSKGDKVF